MEKDSGIDITAKGGWWCVNNFLMQFQADISGLPVIRPENTGATAMGAAFWPASSWGMEEQKGYSGHLERG